MEESDLFGMAEARVAEWYATGHNRRSRLGREVRKFLERKDRFADIELSTEDRQQVFPRRRPDSPLDETHRHGDYHDGS